MPQPTGFLPNDLCSPKGSGDKERSVTVRAGATKGRKKREWTHEPLSHGPALCNPMDWGPPGSSVHGILQARILECIANPFSWGSSWPRDRTQVSHIADKIPYHLSHQGSPIKGIQGRQHGRGNGETRSPPAPATHTPSTSPSSFHGCSLMKQLLQNSKPDAFNETRNHAGRNRVLDDGKRPSQFVSLFQWEIREIKN